MAWSEKAIEEAIAAAKRKFVYYSQAARSDELVSAVSAALDAAAAVDVGAGWNAALEAAEQAISLSAWKHEGDDAHSQGMDAGARHQIKESLAAIRSLKRLK